MAYRPRRWHNEIVVYLGDTLGVPYKGSATIAAAVGADVRNFTALRQDLLDELSELSTVDFGDGGQPPGHRGYVTWDASAFLGRVPTASESASISRALRELSEVIPPLVHRRRLPGEKRLRRVRLTTAGRYRYRQLRSDEDRLAVLSNTLAPLLRR